MNFGVSGLFRVFRLQTNCEGINTHLFRSVDFFPCNKGDLQDALWAKVDRNTREKKRKKEKK